ncbi:TetR family transcriptional regulator [Klebsiella pneumoniae subsp. ozaenae]|uniref:TetR family transcriptional regulator n=1 Tax=Klebsiella pneumoniae subsp. ozaenae TaxID=574 RepID=A0A378BQQ5_KLEPO|nr:TetR family transcriptional regulator [Klebsiella pneumoniae subsp. ozaenae]
MTSKGEQAKNQLIAAAIAPVWRVRPARHHPRYRRPGRAEYRRYHLLFWLERRSVSCLRQWIADFIGDNFRPQAEAAEHLLAGEAPDRQAIRDLILSACHNMILLLTQDDTVKLKQIHFP